MWLLDANMPAKLPLLLREFRTEAATAQSQGWGALSNGGARGCRGFGRLHVLTDA